MPLPQPHRLSSAILTRSQSLPRGLRTQDSRLISSLNYSANSWTTFTRITGLMFVRTPLCFKVLNLHAFQSNSRFEAAKQAILAGLPSSSTPVDKENALSEFYKQWYMQEAERTTIYTTEWRRRNIVLLKLSARVEYERLLNHISNLFSCKSDP